MRLISDARLSVAGLLLACSLSNAMAAGTDAKTRVATPAASATARIVSCDEGPFKKASRATLVAIFGAANVTDAKFPGAEGEGSFRATVLFAKKPADTVHVNWADTDARSPKTLASVEVLGAHWQGPGGIHVGSSLADVEKANGKPFTFYGVDWDYGGIVLNWHGGALGPIKPTKGGPGSITKTCGLRVTFTEGSGTPADILAKVTGEAQFSSADSAVRAAKLVVSKLFVSY